VSDAPLVPFDPVASALEQLKRMPDELSFEIAESYTIGLEWREMRDHLDALHRLDAACHAAGYTINITYAAGSMAHHYKLKRKKPKAKPPLDDAIDL